MEERHGNRRKSGLAATSDGPGPATPAGTLSGRVLTMPGSRSGTRTLQRDHVRLREQYHELSLDYAHAMAKVCSLNAAMGRRA